MADRDVEKFIRSLSSQPTAEVCSLAKNLEGKRITLAVPALTEKKRAELQESYFNALEIHDGELKDLIATHHAMIEGPDKERFLEDQRRRVSDTYDKAVKIELERLSDNPLAQEMHRVREEQRNIERKTGGFNSSIYTPELRTKFSTLETRKACLASLEKSVVPIPEQTNISEEKKK